MGDMIDFSVSDVEMSDFSDEEMRDFSADAAIAAATFSDVLAVKAGLPCFFKESSLKH